MPRKWKLAIYFLTGLVIVVALGLLLNFWQSGNNPPPERVSNYSLFRNQNQLTFENYYTGNYPPNLYQPVAHWTGRLILPDVSIRNQQISHLNSQSNPQTNNQVNNQSSLQTNRQTQINEANSNQTNRPLGNQAVFFEVHHADAQHQNLRGQVVNLQWENRAVVNDYRRRTTRDISFTAKTWQSLKSGNIHPDRLNNLPSVDPLESLTGARPEDDLIVSIAPVEVRESPQGNITLVIASEPEQVVGSFYGLVQIIAREKSNPSNSGDHLGRNSGSDRFLVRHFNQGSRRFDGSQEVMVIPQVVVDREGVRRSTNQDMEKSPFNATGWYVYGAKNSQGIFTVQALEPRELLQVPPQVTQSTPSENRNYLEQQLWENPQKNTATSVLLTSPSPAPWQEGDRAIVMHIFGGIGGKKAEPQALGMIVTGHFSYGTAQIIREPLTGELRWRLTYHQVYAHNPDGIISGKVNWAEYMGNLERGWLGSRPVADALIRFPPVTEEYDFGGNKLSVMGEFTTQLQVMMARYRTGNGTGAALVTPATSCVQDSNQALYITIQKITNQVAQNPQIQTWLAANPDHPQTQRFNQLVTLGKALKKELVPLGIIRADWQEQVTEGTGTQRDNSVLGDFFSGITTWRTLLPRPAFDRLAQIFLDQGADLWFLRTNQIGGNDPDILPLAPTAPFS
ncbi:MAG: abortive infection protein [Coleofasciculaceae cyanobacterium SM2_1_6]|nr:abortive infection protein [Coleofasciculaceae cyanobacterium SM2_1_6]